MKILTSLACTVALLLQAGVAEAQFVKGNEAVHIAPDGSRRVETPPVGNALLAKPCAAARPGCRGAGWHMVETVDALQECTEPYARPTTCRPSTYGKEKRSRLWIVKHNGQWMQCQRPDVQSRCVSTKALPYSAVQ